jgi:SAM-dependent methyltransferase
VSASPSLPFDRVADRYDESRGGPARGALMAADIEPWLVPGRVLEVGVGTGIVAAPLHIRGRDVFGVDLAPAMLARARERLGPRVVCGNALALPIGTAAVDNVVFVAALHAIGEVTGALAEAARALRRGGRLVAVHGPPDREPSDDDVAVALAALDVLRLDRPDTPPVVEAAATAAGPVPVGATDGTPVHFAESPTAVAAGIEQRLWAFLWDVDPETWREVVAPVLTRVRALPDPDRPRPYTNRLRVSVFEAQGTAP